MLQLSDELLFTSAGTIETLPEALSWTVMFLVLTTGASLSSTITVAWAGIELFPLGSVAVKVMMFVPTLPQLKEDLLKA